MIMKNQILTIAAMAALFSFTACSNGGSAEINSADTAAMPEAMPETPAVAEEQGVMVGGSMMVPSKNIVENAMGSSEHTTLVAAVKAGGLAETLMGEGPFTVFAPTNAAFDALPTGAVDKLLRPDMKKDLVSILTYHVVPGALKASDLKDGMMLTTVQGQKLKVTEKEGVWMINNAKVSIADVVSSNGVTHVIDAVLMPAMKK
jgi:uncharacterized surface protein with fasciclin (FAS1) repeats